MTCDVKTKYKFRMQKVNKNFIYKLCNSLYN